MRLELSPLKFLMLFWPLYLLMAVAAALDPKAWLQLTPTTLFLYAFPFIILALALLARERWYLELTPEALVHHTLTKAERFEWRRMGSVEIRAQHIIHLPLIRTLWFAFPTDEAHGVSEQITRRIGRRILLVFGDRSGPETMRLIEAWRRGERLS